MPELDMPGLDSSQPTYEELKPSCAAGWPKAVSAGSQPTYEELKHVIEFEAEYLTPRSQPTYEELKPEAGE